MAPAPQLMGPHFARRAACLSVLLSVASHVMAQNMPGVPQPVPLPHPDLAPPSIPAPGAPLWLILGGSALALILFALVIWILVKQPASSAAPATPPLSRAQKRLQELLLECDTLAPDETAHRVSVILRDYQEGRYLVPAPFRTREELYERGEFQARDVVRKRFGPIAAHSDRLAFAPLPATQEQARALVQESIEALQQEAYYLAESLNSPPPLPTPPRTTPPPLPRETVPPASS